MKIIFILSEQLIRIKHNTLVYNELKSNLLTSTRTNIFDLKFFFVDESVFVDNKIKEKIKINFNWKGNLSSFRIKLFNLIRYSQDVYFVFYVKHLSPLINEKVWTMLWEWDKQIQKVRRIFRGSGWKANQGLTSVIYHFKHCIAARKT